MYQSKLLKPMLICFFVSNAFNKSVTSCIFLSILKSADITSVHEKNQSLKNLAYRPVSLFERYMHRQISEYFETIFSKFQCGYRKDYGTQDCLLAMVVKCKNALDQRKEYGALLTDLSKALDFLPHDLIVAKLHAYGLATELNVRKGLKQMISLVRGWIIRQLEKSSKSSTFI